MNSILEFNRKATNKEEFRKILDAIVYLISENDLSSENDIYEKLNIETKISVSFDKKNKTRTVENFTILLNIENYSYIILTEESDVDQVLNSRTTLTNYVNQITKEFNEWLNEYIEDRTDKSLLIG